MKFSLAVNNLVENAVKYNREDGWVRVTLDADHKFFYIKVSDSGIGIPEEYKERVFERFYRVDKARSRETGGTGLGLAITKSVIFMHHGSIQVEKQRGHRHHLYGEDPADLHSVHRKGEAMEQLRISFCGFPSGNPAGSVRRLQADG